MLTRDGDHLLVRARTRALVALCAHLKRAQPPVPAVRVEDRGNDAIGRRRSDAIGTGGPDPRDVRQIPKPVFIGHDCERRRTAHVDAGLSPHAAARTVGSDEIVGTPLRDSSGREIPRRRMDPLAAIVKADELGTVVDAPMSGALKELAQLVLHNVLRHGALPRGRLTRGQFRGRAPVLVPGDRVHEGEDIGAVRQPAGAHGFLDAPLSEELHGADVASPGLRVVGDARRSLDQRELDAEAVQQTRHDHPDRSAPDDQDPNTLLIRFAHVAASRSPSHRVALHVARARRGLEHQTAGAVTRSAARTQPSFGPRLAHDHVVPVCAKRFDR